MTDQKSSLRVVVGNNERDTVMLDFDLVPFEEVRYWCFRAYRWFKLWGFLILESSAEERMVEGAYKSVLDIWRRSSYHAVFDRPVSWKRNIQVLDWVANESHLPKLIDYALMQGIKGSATLRMSCKPEKGKIKPPPTEVFSWGDQSHQIAKYWATNRVIQKIVADRDRETQRRRTRADVLVS